MVCNDATSATKAYTADMEHQSGAEEPSSSPPRMSSPVDQTYTTALLRGRHPRSFRSERGIYQYVNDSNKRANMRQKSQGHASSDSLSSVSFGTFRAPSGVHFSNPSFPDTIPESRPEQSASAPPHNSTGFAEGSHRGTTHVSVGCPGTESTTRRQQTQVGKTLSTGTLANTSRRRGVRRPRAETSHGGTRPADALGFRGLLGGYLVQRGGTGNAYAYRSPGEGGHFLGGYGQGASGGHGVGHLGQQGRANERPLTVHQRFNTMMGIQRDTPTREEEEEAHLLDSFNDDPSLKLHYGLHVTFQAVQGENGSFVALDMETGEVAMRPLHGLERNQQVTFKLVDLEDPESYRSILYGQSIWLQIVAGPGEPTWKQGGVLGARVHGPGMLPTVVIDPNKATSNATPASAGGTGGGGGGGSGSRPGTSGSAIDARQATTVPPSTGTGLRSLGSPNGASPGWAESAFAVGSGGDVRGSSSNGEGVEAGAEVGGGAGGSDVENGGGSVRVNSAVGGGNTDANRPVGVPYPFKAASSKQGDPNGATNETVLRLMNKSAMVNCRWTVRPVLPDGQSVPGMAEEEVSNMDFVYLEQDFFYMTRLSQCHDVVLKALQHRPRTSGVVKGTRGSAQKHFPVERRGIFQVQVADADELRPGEERSAALMRKAKRGLKRSEARRGGHRTYVHKDRPEDRLKSGAAFPREIRLRTTHFTADSETKAITRAQSPAGATRQRGGAAPTAPPLSWIPMESWGTTVLQAMSDAATAPADRRVAATHARVLREWKQRWGASRSSAPETEPNGDENDQSEANSRDGEGQKEANSDGIHISPMCARCKTLTNSSSARMMLGRYCLCSVNRDIQREVLQGNMKKSGADGASQTAGGHPASPATSAKSSAGTTVGDQAAGGECAGSASRPESAEAQVGGAGMGTGREGNAGDGSRGGGKLSEERGLLVHAASSIALGELRMSTILGSTNGGGLKRVRDRRADRRRKRDPFEALEERLLDAFSPESILRQLERQDETLLKGVRHVERMRARREDGGCRRSGEHHQRYTVF